MGGVVSAINNRELAIGLWIFFGIAGLAYKAKAWGSLKSLLSACFAPAIRTYFFVLSLYVVASVALLAKCGLWGVGNLKTTIYWTIGFAFLAPFSSEKIEKEGEKAFFKRTIKKSIGLSAVIPFIASLYTFSLPVEVLFAGAIIFLSLISAVAEQNSKTKQVAFVANGLLGVIGIIFFCMSTYLTVRDPSSVANAQSLREIFLPALLTLLFIPFLCGSHLFIVYERALSRVDSIIKNPVARSYARRRMITEFRIDLDGVKKWLKHIATFRPATETDVAASIAEIKAVRRREKSPYKVPPMIGWAPHVAREFLSDAGLKARDYYRSYDGWHASSNYLECSSALRSSNIAYYLEGDEFAVLRLILVLNVNGGEDSLPSKEMFENLASILISKALRRYGMEDRAISLESGKEPVVIEGKKVSLVKKDYSGDKGYELELIIEAKERA